MHSCMLTGSAKRDAQRQKVHRYFSYVSQEDICNEHLVDIDDAVRPALDDTRTLIIIVTLVGKGTRSSHRIHSNPTSVVTGEGYTTRAPSTEGCNGRHRPRPEMCVCV